MHEEMCKIEAANSVLEDGCKGDTENAVQNRRVPHFAVDCMSVPDLSYGSCSVTVTGLRS